MEKDTYELIAPHEDFKDVGALCFIEKEPISPWHVNPAVWFKFPEGSKGVENLKYRDLKELAEEIKNSSNWKKL